MLAAAAPRRRSATGEGSSVQIQAQVSKQEPLALFCLSGVEARGKGERAEAGARAVGRTRRAHIGLSEQTSSPWAAAALGPLPLGVPWWRLLSLVIEWPCVRLH